MNKTTKRIGFWASLVTAVSIVVSFIPPLVLKAGSADIQFYFVPALTMINGFLIVIICVHSLAPADKKIFSRLAMAFGIIFAAIGSINYGFQLTFMRQAIIQGNEQVIALLSSTNPYSVFWVMEMLAYTFMGVASLFMLPLFTAKKDRLLKWLWGLNGLIGVASIIYETFGTAQILTPFGLGAAIAWNIVFFALNVSMIGYFRTK